MNDQFLKGFVVATVSPIFAAKLSALEFLHSLSVLVNVVVCHLKSAASAELYAAIKKAAAGEDSRNQSQELA